MKLNSTLNTVISKSIILIINFLVVIFTARIWESRGRGEISLIMLNISLILIFSKIFSGSTIAYHSPRVNKNELLSISFTGSFIICILGSFIFSIIYNYNLFLHFFIISFFSSIVTSFISYFLGSKNIELYNLFSVLIPSGILLFLFILFYFFKITSINAFFYSNYLAYGSIIFFGGFKIFKENPKEVFQISLKNVKKTFTYGLGNETSNFFQFLNYRLTFYFIVENLGYSELGVFSVAVSIAEAILIISKSTSSIHFSNVLNNNDSKQNIIKTSLLAKQNLLICVGLCFIFYFIPNDLFIYIFGNSFYEVKMLTIYLFPGIIAIAASNLYGHYFAGIGNYKVLKNKSYLGFIATIVFAILLIPSFNLIGACITMNLSYIVSSIFLYYKFTLDQSKLNNE